MKSKRAWIFVSSVDLWKKKWKERNRKKIFRYFTNISK